MLQVKELTLVHKKDLRTLVEDMSFVLNPGDKAVLIGEEGNGKSSVLKWMYNPALVEGYCQWSGSLAGNSRSGGLLGPGTDQPGEGNDRIWLLCRGPCIF